MADVPNVQRADYRRFVSDPEGYFAEEERETLDRLLYDIRERHTAEVVLVVLPGIENNDPETFTVELFEAWGIGKQADNNGLLILYKYGKRGERIIRFETGYGLEGALPDITTKRLTERILVPAIADGKDADGFARAFGEIDRLLAEGYEARNDGNVRYDEEVTFPISWENMVSGYLVFAVIVGGLFASGLWSGWRKRKAPVEQYSFLLGRWRHQYWLALIFPALLFLLPLYHWLKGKSRRRLKDCPVCHSKGTVSILQEPNNRIYLAAPQLLEQQLRSVMYIALNCQVCDYRQVIPKSYPLTSYKRCPKCGTKAYRMVEQSQVRNSVIKTYSCKYCNYKREEKIRISDGGGAGPFVGGGFGGGSGSFGGGFGGGMSGGGGSTTHF